LDSGTNNRKTVSRNTALTITKATAAAAGTAFVTTIPLFRGPKARRTRFILYSLLGASAFGSGVHGVLLNGWQRQTERMALDYFIGLGFLNFTGAVMYAVRFPERWFPRGFDVWGSSYQIMHVLVMSGALSHSFGLVRSFHYWQHRQYLPLGVCS